MNISEQKLNKTLSKLRQLEIFLHRFNLICKEIRSHFQKNIQSNQENFQESEEVLVETRKNLFANPRGRRKYESSPDNLIGNLESEDECQNIIYKSNYEVVKNLVGDSSILGRGLGTQIFEIDPKLSVFHRKSGINLFLLKLVSRMRQIVELLSLYGGNEEVHEKCIDHSLFSTLTTPVEKLVLDFE